MASSRSLLVVTLFLAAVTSGFALPAPPGYNQTQIIYASSTSEAPVTSNTLASAIATLNFTATTVCYDITNVSPANTNLTAAHIHIGASNVSGPIYVPLFQANATNPAKLKACVPAPANQIAAILANSSGYYFNAHSVAQPAGLFRGQLGNTYQVALSGEAINGHPSDSSGSGSITLSLGDTYVCYTNVVYAGGDPGNATSGDLVQRVPGWGRYNQGNLIANLFTGNPPTSNCTGNLSPVIIQQVKDDPVNYFCVVNGKAFSRRGGPVGGPLVAPANFTARFTLLATSAAEVPSLIVNRTALGGTGNMTVTLDITPTSICYAITNISAGVRPPTSAQIHSGGPAESDATWIRLFDGGYKPAGCPKYDLTALLLDIVRNPSTYFFEADNADYPDGVVRAQLGPSLTVNLLGSQEIPAANVNPANGSLILTLGLNSVCYSNLTFSGPIRNLTAGHIHNGTAGVSGDIVVPLFSATPLPSACAPASNATLAKIFADPTHYYVNIHSTTFPAGVARQQLAISETVLNSFS